MVLTTDVPDSPLKTFWGLTGYQWLVVLAAWVGWGFDVFDALLFNYVSRLCIPDLLQLAPDDPRGPQIINHWTGSLTSLLLVGWGIGGILFGKITDRIGRTRTLLITMLTYSLGTAACALATNVWMLAGFRFIAALGIGGEWAAGAALVAETVPERKRVLAGALLQTASPLGLLLATFVTDLFTRRIDSLASNPSLAWRLVFLCGLAPAAAAAAIRFFVHEPPTWQGRSRQLRSDAATASTSMGEDLGPPRVRELFAPRLRARTLGGLAIAVLMLLTWWVTNAFLPRIAALLASEAGRPEEAARFITMGTNAFNLGGLVGALLTVPIAVSWGRRPLFLIYFLGSAVSMFTVFGIDCAAETRLRLMVFVGVAVYGAFGALPFYLPELFPARLRGTGSGFCYNVGRFVAAPGPFAVPVIAQWAQSDLRQVIQWAALFPLLGIVLIFAGLGHETRNGMLEK